MRALRLLLQLIFVPGILLLTASCHRHEAKDCVRVNQIGYEINAPMRAYLMSRGAATRNKFFVKKSDGELVQTGEVGAASGNWNHYTVSPLDFRLATPGMYTIEVGGTENAISPSFRVDAPSNLYSRALANSLSFYQVQRDGPDFIPSALRTAAAHLNDKEAKVHKTPTFAGREGSRIQGDLEATGAEIDASGGWWDAGDCLKFVDTTSYTLALMLVGVRDFPDQMGGGTNSINFRNEAKFGLEWLRRMWDDSSKTLYYQVGIGSGNWSIENDHSVWRLPQEDDTYRGAAPHYRYIRNRPVFLAAPAGSKISPNLAGRIAGDFALCFTIYRASDTDFANGCLLAAEHIFDLADTSPGGELLTSAPHDFYGETEWRDDMEFAATELYFATRKEHLPEGLPHNDSRFYLQAATRWASAYIHNGSKPSVDLGRADISGLAHFELYRGVEEAKELSGLEISTADLLGDLRAKLERAVEVARSDPFAYGYPWGGGDTPSHGASLAIVASEYDYLSKSDTYAKFASGWLDNILGANAWGISFLVGDGSTFPKCVHHQVANLTGSHDGRTPILAGAMVEGPVKDADSGVPRGVLACPPDGKDLFSEFAGNGAEYRDNVKFYSTNEPAIDLSAPSFLLFSWRMAGAPSSKP
jgi:endoglucanase